MRKGLLGYLFILVLSFPAYLTGQAIERRFVNFSLENGLSQSTILDIKQDALGYTWLATAEGVNVFDGSNFEVYKNSYKDTNTLSDNFVYAVLPFNDGTVWAITQGRMINEINVKTKKVRHIGLLPDLKESMYSALQLLEGPNGNIWISTQERGIIVVNREGKMVKRINLASGLINSNEVQQVHMGVQYVWVSTTNGLSRIDNDLNNSKHYFPGQLISAVHTYKNRLYLSFNQSTLLTQGNITNPNRILDTIVKGEYIITIANQKNGTLWLGTFNNGVIEVNEGKQYHHKKTQLDRWSLIDNNIFSIYADPNDNIWIGTNSGLSVYKRAYNLFKLYRHNDNWNSLSSNKVFDIFEDEVGAIWFINYNGTLDRLENGVFKTFDPKEKDNGKSFRIRSIHQTKNGDFYVGSVEKGVFQFFPEKDLFKRLTAENTQLLQVRKIVNLDSSQLLIAHDEGMATYNLKTQELNTKVFPSNFVTYDFYLKDKTLWVATFASGLYKINITDWTYKNFRHTISKTSLSNNNVMAIVAISNDTLALGTYGGGISLLDTKTETFLNFSEADGLGNNSVYGIISDKRSNLWLSTNKGISKWYSNRKLVKNYDLPIQLQSLEFNEDAFLKSSDGTYYFGGVKGVNFFKPEEIVPNTNTPLAIISYFRANDIEKDISEVSRNNSVLKLQSKENYIQIYFNAMRFAVPEKTQFQYKLEGIDNEWIIAENSNFVRYNNLAPGTYTFMLKSCNEDGYCDEKIQKLTFSIATPFFKTFWFLGLLALTFFGIVFYVYRYRTQNMRREYAAKMTNAELRALRIQMNPHFIFNSLNSIQYYVLNADSKTAYKYLTKFSSLMRRTLQNSKENFLPIKDELESLSLYLELENMRLENSLQIEIAADPKIDQERTLVPTLFMQPFVENAIIHGLLPKNGNRNILIKIERLAKGIKCIIEDNGIGRNASRELNKKRNRSHQSTALTAIENRIKILNSSANTKIKMEIVDLYEDNNAQGTRVILEVV